MIQADSSIGLFDSGVGGLTVYKALREALPNESLIYFGDTARVPYGTKSQSTVQGYSKQILEFLLQSNVKMVVVACNSATALSLEYLQDISPVPVVGVIEPGAQKAVSVSQNHKIGLVATEATVRSRAYETQILKYSSQALCESKATPLFVSLVEENIQDQAVRSSLLDYYLKDFAAHEIDTLILGCTHFPLLKDEIQSYLGDGVQVVDSAETTAQAVKTKLQELGALASKSKNASRIYVSDQADRFLRIAQTVLQKDLPEVLSHQFNT